MSGTRQKIQYSLALVPEGRGEAPGRGHQGTEPPVAKPAPERPACAEQLMEEVCDRGNLVRAWKRVRSNRGSPGVDGMTIEGAEVYLREHWPNIRSQLLSGTYQPQPVKRVEIPKPDGGVRKLGVPCVVDRLIQQALLQVLQEQWDPTFSDHSYGFRPGRSAHQAVAQAQHYIAEGYSWVVDLDLEKFFDRVNHDKLMGQIIQRVEDERLRKLIRAFLNAGVMENGLVSPSVEETPQGGPLSPLLSNLVLDELDQELERRGHRYVRYADDCNIYVRSERAGQRVMKSITRFITQKLKLKVNQSKSAVARPQERKFLGFSFTDGPEVQRVIAPKALDRFKRRVREITRRAKVSASRRPWRSWPPTCGVGAAISASAKRHRNSSSLLVGSGCDFEWLFGGSGKLHVVAGPHFSNWGDARDWRTTPLAVIVVPDTSHRPRPSLSGFPMLTSNRSDFHPYTRRASVTNSNR